MEIHSNILKIIIITLNYLKRDNNNKDKEKNSQNYCLLPFIYIKKAILRIWKFLPSGMSICFNCNYF